VSRSAAEVRRQLEVAALDAAIAAHRVSVELGRACAIETTETSDLVQAVRMRVYAANEARDIAIEAYVDHIDGVTS